MAEILSKQTALIAAGKHLINAGDAGRERAVMLVSPVTFTAPAINDTMGSGQLIPKGARPLAAVLSVGAGAASSTVSIGLRNFYTKAVIDATAFGSAAAINAAGIATVNNGTKVSGGVDYVTDQDSEMYLTFTGATGAANQAIVCRGLYLGA